VTTRLANVGMGKMGHAIEQLAGERGCAVVARLDVAETTAGITSAALNGAEVAVEFTTPGSAAANVRGLIAAGIPTVVGTTGWYDALPEITADVKKRNGALLTATNFSLGVNAFEAILTQAAAILAATGGFDAHMIELHHSAKKDAPSGTAHTLKRRRRRLGGSRFRSRAFGPARSPGRMKSFSTPRSRPYGSLMSPGIGECSPKARSSPRSGWWGRRACLQ
jgi:4-hydroxy-tetrahydrodipicolinate reductase